MNVVANYSPYVSRFFHVLFSRKYQRSYKIQRNVDRAICDFARCKSTSSSAPATTRYHFTIIFFLIFLLAVILSRLNHRVGSFCFFVHSTASFTPDQKSFAFHFVPVQSVSCGDCHFFSSIALSTVFIRPIDNKRMDESCLYQQYKRSRSGMEKRERLLLYSALTAARGLIINYISL